MLVTLDIAGRALLVITCMSALNAAVTGALIISPSPGADARGTGGCNFGLSLLDANGGPGSEVSQLRANINTPSPGWQALPWDTGIQVRVLFIRALSSAVFGVRLTRSATGLEVQAARTGLTLMEFSADDFLELVEIQGTVMIEWAAFGPQI